MDTFVNYAKTLTNSELEAHLKVLNSEIFRRLDAPPKKPIIFVPKKPSPVKLPGPAKSSDIIVNTVPVGWRRKLPVSGELRDFFEKYTPITLSKVDMTNQIETFLKMFEICPDESTQFLILEKMYSLLEKNLWLLKGHKRFRETVVGKLYEMESCQAAESIAAKYAWMKLYPFPPKEDRVEVSKRNCRYCDSVGYLVVKDGPDYFCNQEHCDSFSENGDCSINPVRSKTELDQELDEIQKVIKDSRERLSE